MIRLSKSIENWKRVIFPKILLYSNEKIRYKRGQAGKKRIDSIMIFLLLQRK